MPESQAQKASNLARIRDNQRRSRARRKEYLQELESKYRECESAGVAVSTEIQSAARRVVDENKRLRQLLKQQGLSDADINATLLDDEGEVPPSSALEKLLAAPTPCVHVSRARGDRSNSSISLSQSGSPGPVPQPSPDYRPIRPQQQQQEQATWPTELYENASRTAQFGVDYSQNASPFANSTVDAPLPQSYDHMYQHYENSPYPPSDHTTPLDQHLAWLHNYPTAEFLKGVDQAHLQPNNHNGMNGQNGMYSSCEKAAETIRVFRQDAGYELEQELGCSTSNDPCRVSCQVSNQEVLRLVNKYTAHSGR